ncbi:cation:proton antiporter [Eubacteriales bacterium OttesenSCG-928-G02]|nr:cation:proton antiporter [Eubacteriales bacterium OttesenSCG-928-G02]
MSLAIMLFAGLLLGRLFKLFKFPNVTGYIVAGLILRFILIKFTSTKEAVETIESFDIISEMTLAFIAFTIGLTFKRSYFKRVGFTPVVIALFEALCAVFLVQGVLIAIGVQPSFAIVLGAIAAATAPAATLMIIKQYNAKGPVTETLMSVVAIDDAVALVAFSFAITIANIIQNGITGNIFISILSPFYEVILALIIGAVLGLLFKIPLRFFKKDGNRLIIIVGFVFLSSAAAALLNVSTLLTCMATGAVLCNITEESEKISAMVDYITPPLFLMFFVVSGAELDLTILPKIGVIGSIYVVFRVIGKLLGAFVGSKIMKAPPTVCKYLGPTLLPQAGVAIGLTIVAQSVVPNHAPEIKAVILCSVLIYELIGPVVTKISLKKAGEIKA